MNVERENLVKVFDLIVKKGYSITFKEPITIEWLTIKKIVGVKFNSKDYPQRKLKSVSGWNEYYNIEKKAIGVNNYYEAVLNEYNTVIGLLAFYDNDGKEIKMKYFNEHWSDLLEKMD